MISVKSPQKDAEDSGILCDIVGTQSPCEFVLCDSLTYFSEVCLRSNKYLLQEKILLLDLHDTMFSNLFSCETLIQLCFLIGIS